VAAYQEKPFKSVAQGGADLSKIAAADGADDKPETPATDIAPLIAAVKAALGPAVKDVRASARLTSSAVCLVADEGDVSMHLERLLRKNRGGDEAIKATRILELNPKHPLIERLAGTAKDGGAETLVDAAWLLFDQARVVEGEPPTDPAAFARRLAAVLERAL
jgi:molecular chaperone HtpG